MSKPNIGCWNCNSLAHHRRDCDAAVSEEFAKKTKQDLQKAFREGRAKTNKEKEEWHRKLEARTDKPLPRRFLREHIEIFLQEVMNVEYELADIGVPTEQKISNQLERARKLKKEFVDKMPTMREVVSASKTYIRSLKLLDDEYPHFKLSLEDLDSKRQPVYSQISRAVADLEEVTRLAISIENLAAVVNMEITECDGAFEGERSPGESETLLLKMRDITPLLADMKLKITRTQSICPNYKLELISDLEQRFDDLWHRRKAFAEIALQRLRSKEECPICLDQYSATRLCFVLNCGHQVCGSCLNSLRNGGRLCGICRKPFINAIRMF